MCCTSVAEFAEVCQKEITKFEADIELDKCLAQQKVPAAL
jgi:hypothetical protein